jgi:hypothetical protein
MASQQTQEDSASTQNAQDITQKKEHTSNGFRKLFGKSTKRGGATVQGDQKAAKEKQLENTLFRYNASRDRRNPQCKV